ncbi:MULTISPECIES: thioredoxin-dependent thiol peroxidase [unclassified Plantactinospora]|uniref:thioredoxin-dependent thiol peroxidase n=1 Tax=unclassified Plantactinospora TaxID=2631981 RepID=UPI000D16FE74|nr:MULTISPECIES: thioredoxin-dependent thiol peroxidase [unclassified Plantactinospora]AVT30251.1 thioredoxin-dependent thiol peroxidase [Plantactinospora sp. BC1]AVT37139.1 thioredoxin-dependent thiol peroxidase [Plantactinospora sp. BB1]
MTSPIRLAPGDAAPDFALPTDTGETLSLKELRGRKVVLYAYPRAMTPGCTTQACDFRDSLASLQAAGYEVVGISPDTPAELAKFRERDAITFPLVSDRDREVLVAYGAYGEKQSYGRTITGVIRSTFVIDEEGRIERALYNVKATGHVAKLRRDLGLD